MLPTTPDPRRRVWPSWRPFAVLLLVALAGALTLHAVSGTPSPNGLGVLPAQQTILERSGVALQVPTGKATVRARSAAKAAAKDQPGSAPTTVLLARAEGAHGSALSPPGRLCWVVFLEPGSDAEGDAPAPGQIQLDVVLVDAHTGGVIEGFIAFRSTTAHSRVGTE
ncbi:MAG TPA: hypothetical protein VI138_05020 [Candidatus Dormibacteraeota bacterium]